MSEAPAFGPWLKARGLAPPVRRSVATLQVNVGLRCDLACHHCHVEAGPKRTEALDARGADRVLELLAMNPAVTCLDLTGGAPEMNPHFRKLVEGARSLGRRVVDRCNLTILFEPGQEDTAEFLAQHQVEVVASLPCYTAERVERQRGRGVFDRSIEGLLRLCDLGYGVPASPLRLDLVYNPIGPELPPAEAELAHDYRQELARLGIGFHGLRTITNMPIKRFARDLARQGRDVEYMSLLVHHFNPATLEGVMCREMLSVDHEGRLYDCDFNQALALPLSGPWPTIWDVDDLDTLQGNPIATGSHCFGCTAGAGSSCGGSLT